MLGLPYNQFKRINCKAFEMEKLTASLEDYLEIIYSQISCNKNIKAIDISKKLKITRASVTEALKKLEHKGFINYGRYDSISLTESGIEIAKNILSKHQILQDFFIKVLNLPEEEASINACKIEHVITENAFNKIAEYTSKQG